MVRDYPNERAQASEVSERKRASEGERKRASEGERLSKRASVSERGQSHDR